jgi:hypothetical protein
MAISTRRGPRRIRRKAETLEQGLALLDDRAVRARAAQHVAGDAMALADGKEDILQDAEAVEQRVDLESAADAALHPFFGGQRGHVGAAEQDLPGTRLESPGDQIDEGRLARAVRTDQRVTGAGRKAEIDVAGNRQRAERLAERARLQCRLRAHRNVLARNRSAMPSTPPRANITTRTSNKPIQNSQ